MGNWWKNKDPDARAEQKKYSSPVPSRSFILQYFHHYRKALSYEALCLYFELNQPDQLAGLKFRLKAMCREGQLIKNKKNVFCLPGRLKQKTGRIQANKEGFGFFIPDDKTQDFFLSPVQMQSVWHGDRVTLQFTGKICHIIDIVERAVTHIVGIYREEAKTAFVVPENPVLRHKVLIKGQKLKPKIGQYVLIKITQHPKKQCLAIGEIENILDAANEASIDILIAQYTYGLALAFPTLALKQASSYQQQSVLEATQDRKDLRSLPFITIDGAEAQDFDDAVYAEKQSNSEWFLWVAIADVSHYVKPNDALDLEAISRGTSVYFPSHVIPMLPENLSNDLCSLKPHCDRLTLVCEMKITAKGQLKQFVFYEAVIQSSARLTYDEVLTLLQNDQRNIACHPSDTGLYDPTVLSNIKQLHALYCILNETRHARGALEFDTRESHIVFDAEHKIKSILPVQRHDIHKLIEECMLCANEAAAQFLEKNKLPALYRVHKGPTAQKQQYLFDLLKNLGVNCAITGKVTPKDYQMILETTTEHEAFYIIQMTILRSLGQAEYHLHNTGHFGLAFKAYTHFTSPIRRYPDLLVHRAIKSLLSLKNTASARNANAKKKTTHAYPYSTKEIEQLALHCSLKERQAEEANRYTLKSIMCRYMLNKIGQHYTGKVVSVVHFGLFVELDMMPITGLIALKDLPDDDYIYQEKMQSLVGDRSHIIFSLGQSVSVCITAVDMDEKHIQLKWIAS
ncbi:MAG: ribonuclease R [Endozoicomonadaceae bacterium]|nr:ribonuclease R [Endozoicomonadaceae bacterium]MBE8232793.1 ribonuclease R [Endozoicomonadaceae bacterium]